MEKICPICGCKFVCLSDKITECQCIKVELTPKQREVIRQQFDNCLCIDCLKNIGKK